VTRKRSAYYLKEIETRPLLGKNLKRYIYLPCGKNVENIDLSPNRNTTLVGREPISRRNIR
jgi:hypothetical protein